MNASAADAGKLLRDENEQLRTALESALEENVDLADDRDRLLRRVAVLAGDLQSAAQSHRAAMRNGADIHAADIATRKAEATTVRSHTEEELRVSFEELQVLAEELEVANTSLQQSNDQLEERVTERTREIAATSAALGRSEARFRTLVEGMPQLVWRAVDVGRWTWCSPQWCSYTGQSQDDSLDFGWLDAFHPDDREATMAAWAVAEEREGFDVEARICDMQSGRYRHFRTRASPVRGADGRLVEWLGTSTDVDDIMRLQEQQAVLVDELQHRTRNLMAVVQAVMTRTMRSSTSIADFQHRIDDRMQALARVQGLLSRRSAGTRVAFDTLLREELAAHVELDEHGNSAQVTMGGPGGVPLRSAVVQTFALALHELTTNAVKYGALSRTDGRLAVRWWLDPIARRGPVGKNKARLCVDWRESGVTDIVGPAEAPLGTGYGRELIERALPYQLGARTSFTLTEDGVHCTIAMDVEIDEVRTPDEVRENTDG